MKLTKNRGFSLIELMVVVVIVAVCAAVGYPAYTQHVQKSNRSAAESVLMQAAAQQEKYLLDARSYATLLSALNVSAPTNVSNIYTIGVDVNNSATPPTYSITATPISGKSAALDACGTLSYNQAGTKGVSSSTVASCW
jgi:type IV pilus assembly protein PilE